MYVCVFVYLSVHLGGERKQISPDCTCRAVNSKIHRLPCTPPPSIYLLSSRQPLISSFSLLHQFSCFSAFPLPPDVQWMHPICLSVCLCPGPWRPTLTPNGCAVKCFHRAFWKETERKSTRKMMQHASTLSLAWK